jgi:hypothetical protein
MGSMRLRHWTTISVVRLAWSCGRFWWWAEVADSLHGKGFGEFLAVEAFVLEDRSLQNHPSCATPRPFAADLSEEPALSAHNAP